MSKLLSDTGFRPAHSRILLLIVLTLGTVTACAELDQWSNTDDYIGPFRPDERHALTALPGPSYKAPPATQPRAAEAGAATQPSGEEDRGLGPVEFTVQGALLVALENNPQLHVDRFNPDIQRTFEQQQRAVFDPVIDAGISAGRNRAVIPTIGTTAASDTTVNSINGNLSATQFLPTGTTINLGATTNYTDSTANTDTALTTRVGLSVTQSLLRGAGVEVNLANLRQSRIDVLSSQYELRGFAETLLESVENAYWDYALAQRQIEIVSQSLQVALDQLAETQELVRLGKLAERLDLPAAEAEVALRREDLIDARAARETARLSLLRLVAPRVPAMWDRPVVLDNQPFIAEGELDTVDTHVEVAHKMRADLNQARLQVKRGDLEIVKTRNGLLPKMDLFINLGKTGYANSFGQSVGNIAGRSYDALGGLSFELPVFNRDPEAQNLRARLSRDQATASVDNLMDLVELDVRSQYIEVKRTREQITATAASRRLQEIKLEAEREKFRLGKSNSILVAQAERDFTASQIAEVQAVVANLKAAVTLFRLEGSLLERRGIAAPAPNPVP
jgi:outer membrane protein TolC